MKRIICSACFLVSILMTSLAVAEELKIRVEFDAPATNYRVAIHDIYRVGDQLWVVSRVSTEGDFGGTAITRVSDEVTVDAPKDTQVVHKVLGKTWNWGKDTKSLQHVKSEKVLKELLEKEAAKRIWQRKKPDANEDAKPSE